MLAFRCKELSFVSFELGSNEREIFWCLFFTSKVRAVVTVHDPGRIIDGLFRLPSLSSAAWPFPGIERRYYQLLDKLIGERLVWSTVLRCRRLYCLNQSMASQLSSKALYLPQPVYSPRPRQRIIPSKLSFAYTGYWSTTKGLDYLFDAYVTLAQEFPHATFILGGQGTNEVDEYSHQLRARIQTGPSNILAPGFIPSAELDSFLANLSALVLPYLPEVPGAASGMLMRAQEQAIPLILTRTPAFLGQVAPDDATFIEPANVAELVEAIRAIIENPNKFNHAAERAQSRLYETHSWEAVAKVLKETLPIGAKS